LWIHNTVPSSSDAEKTVGSDTWRLVDEKMLSIPFKELKLSSSIAVLVETRDQLDDTPPKSWPREDHARKLVHLQEDVLVDFLTYGNKWIEAKVLKSSSQNLLDIDVKLSSSNFKVSSTTFALSAGASEHDDCSLC
jgi:hypothetical protein